MSQVNKKNENNDQVFSEFNDDHFRTNFFDSTKRVCPVTNDPNKRAKLDASIISSHQAATVVVSPSPCSPTDMDPTLADSPVSLSTPTQTPTPVVEPTTSAASTSTKHQRRFNVQGRRYRSRSLPILHNFSSRQQIIAYNHNQILSKLPPPLPPVNLQSLKEIDLAEILKNPQLRHDILFDPQLQFRPNLDGERGRRKRANIDKYWSDVEKECKEIFVTPEKFNAVESRIPTLFNTLREILLSLLPTKDRDSVADVMDTDLLIQQLSHGVFDFVALAEWLANVFKSHCAPMRDSWVTEMALRFKQAEDEKSIPKLIMGLRMNFSILEAMKLDVANHQIRMLRPMLIETAVEFERDYFQQIISRCKLDLSDSLNWFKSSYHKKHTKINNNNNNNKNNSKKQIENSHLRNHIVSAILDLLSCRNMVNEFPSTLTFDTNRLVLLRADVRQQVCIEICLLYYKQLSFKNQKKLSEQDIKSFKQEILDIVTDDNGNVKWTRNIHSISLQIIKKLNWTNKFGKLELPEREIDLAYGWLIKQIQPTSIVYGKIEDKFFGELYNIITSSFENNVIDPAMVPITISGNTDKKITIVNNNIKNDELHKISEKILKLSKFHWDVFGSYYTDSISK